MFEKKYIWISLVIPMLTLLQGIIAHSSFQDGLEFDLLILGTVLIVPVLLLCLVFRLLKIPSSALKYAILVLLIIGWVLINTELFNDYEASWSTFSTEELWMYGVSISIIPAMLASVLWLQLFYLIEKRWKT